MMLTDDAGSVSCNIQSKLIFGLPAGLSCRLPALVAHWTASHNVRMLIKRIEKQNRSLDAFKLLGRMPLELQREPLAKSL